MLLSSCVGLIAALFPLFGGNLRAETPPVRHLRLTYTAYLTGLSAPAQQAAIWIPIPTNNDRQQVTILTNDLRGGELLTEPKYGNRLYYRRVSLGKTKPTDTLRITLAYSVSIAEKTVSTAEQLTLVPTHPVDPALHLYLTKTRLIPLSGPIDSLKQKIKLPAAPVLAARNIYDYLIDNMVYEKVPGSGIGDVAWACSSKTGDCSDYHSVFIAICRSIGIPADHVFGLPLRGNRGSATGWHCWARYYVDGPGWITIDASEADKHPEKRDYFFGTLSPDFLTLSHGRDVPLPHQQGPALNLFAEPYVEVDGKPMARVKWQVNYEAEAISAR